MNLALDLSTKRKVQKSQYTETRIGTPILVSLTHKKA